MFKHTNIMLKGYWSMSIQIDHDSPIPLHAQVEALIRSMIADPEYRDGKLLPKETDLARRLGVSRNTVRQAMTKLVHEGLIVRRRSVGSVVSTANDALNDLSKFVTFPEELVRMERRLENLDVTVGRKKCDRETAAKLDIEPSREVLVVHRLKGIGSSPVVLFVSYYHPRLGFDETYDFEKPLYELLDREYAIVPSRSCEDLHAIASDESIADVLEVPFGSPVLLRDRLVLDAGGIPIERNLCYYRSDRYSFSINIDISRRKSGFV